MVLLIVRQFSGSMLSQIRNRGPEYVRRVGLPDFRVRNPGDFQTIRASKARCALCFNNVQQKSLHCNVGRPKRLLLLWLC